MPALGQNTPGTIDLDHSVLVQPPKKSRIGASAYWRMGIFRYFAMLAGSIDIASVHPWWPKHMVQCSTSQDLSTLRHVSHMRPKALMSVQAWQSLVDTSRGRGFRAIVWAMSFVMMRTSSADSSSTASPRTWWRYLLMAACVTPRRSATTACFIP